jgi:hypothetical protein
MPGSTVQHRLVQLALDQVLTNRAALGAVAPSVRALGLLAALACVTSLSIPMVYVERCRRIERLPPSGRAPPEGRCCS